MTDREDIQRQTESEFRELEDAQPGVMDLLQAYGGYEAALHQADDYLNLLEPQPVFTTTDSSGRY